MSDIIKLTNTNERRLEVHPDEEGYIISEKISYVPPGHSRRKWDEQRVWISEKELQALAARAK